MFFAILCKNVPLTISVLQRVAACCSVLQRVSSGDIFLQAKRDEAMTIIYIQLSDNFFPLCLFQDGEDA